MATANGDAQPTMSHSHLNYGPYPIPLQLFQQNRERLVRRILQDHPELGGTNAYVLLQGGITTYRYDTDSEPLFRQESYFMWAFGVLEPDCYAAIGVDNGLAITFIPRLPREYGVWMGKIKPLEHFRAKYGVADAYYTDEIAQFFIKQNCNKLLVLRGPNTDSGATAEPATFPGIEKFAVDQDSLFHSIAECRVIKTELEIDVFRYVNRITSDAHKRVMRTVKPGIFEYQVEAEFKHDVLDKGGCRHVSYTCICATGDNSATLHYGHAGAPNDKVIKNGDMCLFDLGAEYLGFTSDVTCSYPVNGKFTNEQRQIYNAVLRGNRAVQAAMRPGVSWADMHLLAERVQLEELVRCGLLVGNINEMMQTRLGAVFFPHGLGHFMGMDVHDVHGYPPEGPERPKEAGIKCLRTARLLQAGMVITVEPGIYFIDMLLDAALADERHAKFINKKELEKYRGFGGVRIEDDVLVTENGSENLTTVPRTVAEIESWMAGGGSGPALQPGENTVGGRSGSSSA